MPKYKKLYCSSLHCQECKCTFYWIVSGPVREIAGKLVARVESGKQTPLYPVCPNCRSKELYAWEVL